MDGWDNNVTYGLRQLGAAIAAFIVVMIALSYIVGKACASDEQPQHPAHEMPMHEKFYATWNMPDQRGVEGARHMSCCNKHDCHSAEMHRRDGQWYVFNPEVQQWLLVPENKLEHNYSDAHDSPDGRNHACYSGLTVYCAVLGSGM